MSDAAKHKHHAGQPHHAKHKSQEKRFITHELALARQEVQLASLNPFFAARATSLVDYLNSKGWQAFIWEGKTRSAEQAAANAKKGTGIELSWHRPDVNARLHGQLIQLYAADIIDERWGWLGPTKDLDHQFWKDLGSYAKVLGLEWGGTWPNRDVAHVQMRIIDSALGRVDFA